MDQFMADILEAMKLDCEIIAQVFPPEQDILLAYADRVANEIISVYISQLLDHTKTISKHMYLRSCAATFVQVFKMVKMLLEIEPKDESIVSQARCEDVVYLMWESNMNEYLETEGTWVREEMEAVTEQWEKDRESEVVDAAFITSQNPAAVKRSVLSGFKDVLLLPVTVVPRTAGIVGGAMIRTAGTGLSSLNPRRWQSGAASTGTKRSSSPTGLHVPTSANSVSNASLPRTPNDLNEKGYMDFSNGAIGGLDSGSEDDDEEAPYGNDFNEKDEWSQEVAAWGAVASARPVKEKTKSNRDSVRDSVSVNTVPKKPPQTLNIATNGHSRQSSRPETPTLSSHAGGKSSLTQMQLLLSLDTALQVIHVNRDCLKRIETFLKYPLPLGERVRLQIQDVSLLCLRALGEGHINPGFKKATQQIQEWSPEEHTKDQDEQEVEPLIHFFELVHVGDTIAQMVQVYFDQELSRHIDRKDFLNPVIKGKKKFESNLDEAVAKGLNAGVDLLLGQVEHIISTRQDIKDYFPDKGMLTDLSPTKACREAVDCLQLHCRMLVGATDKNVLEVFYQEVGIRLFGMIVEHLKRQIISIDGGFKLIADLNHYHAFVVTLKQPNVTLDFNHMKMLGNIFIIDNPKELAKIARDANLIGGLLSPEEVYELLHSRSDFAKIVKALDKEMYGFKASEDCQII
jgi:recyclin-1